MNAAVLPITIGFKISVLTNRYWTLRGLGAPLRMVQLVLVSYCFYKVIVAI